MIDQEHKDELDRELAREIKEEPLTEWVQNNLSSCEKHFIESFPVEDRPLDDDIPDFFHNYADVFDEFCRGEYEKYRD